MVKIVVLFNGPPRSGKDTYANELTKYIPNAQMFHLAGVLKNVTHNAYGLFDVPYDYFEENKDLPNDIFLGKTPRECYIHMSENYLKPLHGTDFFIKKAVDMIRNSNNNFWLIPDCGFDEEVEYLSKCEDLVCIYVILEREGKNFNNDSRKYINTDYININKDYFINKFVIENRIEENGKEIYDNIKKYFTQNIIGE